MSTIEIIIIGLTINFISFFVISILNTINIHTMNKFDVQNVKEMLYLESLKSKAHKIQLQCRKKHISILTQHLFIILIPFASIFQLFESMFGLFSGNLTTVNIKRIERYVSILEERLKRLDNG